MRNGSKRNTRFDKHRNIKDEFIFSSDLNLIKLYADYNFESKILFLHLNLMTPSFKRKKCVLGNYSIKIFVQ